MSSNGLTIGRMSGLFDDAQLHAIVKLINGDKSGKADFKNATVNKLRRK